MQTEINVLGVIILWGLTCYKAGEITIKYQRSTVITFMTPSVQSTEGSFMPKGETNGFLLRL